MPNFVSFAAPVAELAHGEKSRTQITQLAPIVFFLGGGEMSRQGVKRRGEKLVFFAVLSCLEMQDSTNCSLSNLLRTTKTVLTCRQFSSRRRHRQDKKDSLILSVSAV